MDEQHGLEGLYDKSELTWIAFRWKNQRFENIQATRDESRSSRTRTTMEELYPKIE